MGAAFFTTTSWGPSTGGNNNSNPSRSGSRSRPGTSSGTDRDHSRDPQAQTKAQTQGAANSNSTNITTTSTHAVLTKDRERKSSFGRKSSFTSPSKSRRRASSITSNHHHDAHARTDASAPPAIPSELVLSAKSPKESDAVTSPTAATTTTTATNHGGRSASGHMAMNGYSGATSPPTVQTGPGNPAESSSFSVHQHIHELANKRISTLDYLRKAYVTRPRPLTVPCDAIPVVSGRTHTHRTTLIPVLL